MSLSDQRFPRDLSCVHRPAQTDRQTGSDKGPLMPQEDQSSSVRLQTGSSSVPGSRRKALPCSGDSDPPTAAQVRSVCPRSPGLRRPEACVHLPPSKQPLASQQVMQRGLMASEGGFGSSWDRESGQASREAPVTLKHPLPPCSSPTPTLTLEATGGETGVQGGRGP